MVADGTDNFPTRYLVNDACVLAGKPNVYGSVYQFEGQVAVFNYRSREGNTGPNYRDLYPSPPPAGLVPNCAESGVLGVLPGIVGSMQALEVIKIITGIGKVMSGKIVLFDALTLDSRTFTVKRKADNPLNGEQPTINKLIDYEAFCGIGGSFDLKQLSADAFRLLLDRGEEFQLIDVREPHEYQQYNLGGELMPLRRIDSYTDRIVRDKKVIVHCEMGGRSEQAIKHLEDNFGFSNLFNLEGGIKAYLAKYPED